jgi:feruloyl esterase
MFEKVTGVPGCIIDVAFARGAGHIVELLCYRAPANRKTSTLRACDPGFWHLCLKVRDIEQVVRAIRASDFEPVSEIQTATDPPVKGLRVVYVRDPDGVVLELVEEPPGLCFCRVNAVIEKEINLEVWLPTDWNQRFQGVGNGGLTGALNHPGMAGAVNAHFATASTDTGHVTGRDAFQSDWIESHPQRVVDFGYRAHHLMAERAKEIIAAFYGKRAAHNYYSGCSSGGWQGLTEAQKYPGDYDGIVAGAPAINYLGAVTRGMVLAQAAAKEPEGNLDGAASQLLVQAATAKCDAQDGLKDELVSDPIHCTFDPAELQCEAGQTQGCLSAAQVRRAKLTYGPLTSAGGLKLYPGPTWGTAAFFALPPAAAGSAPAAAPTEDPLTAMTKALPGKAPQWTPTTFDPEKHTAQLLHDLGPTLNSLDPDLKAFKGRGGKLILYHGGADPGLSPYNTLDYITSVESKLGKPAVGAFVRTYLAPGMGHCGAGTGPSLFDTMTPLVAWVERGEAPKEIVATQPGPNGKVVRSRPLYPYPQVARYKGAGPADAASSFACR